MSEQSDDMDFNFEQNSDDAFDSVTNKAPGSAPLDSFDKLDSEQEGGVYSPQQRSSQSIPVSEGIEEGGVRSPTARSRRQASGRKWLKPAAAVVMVGLIGAGGVVFGLPFFTGTTFVPPAGENVGVDRGAPPTPGVGGIVEPKPAKVEQANPVLREYAALEQDLKSAVPQKRLAAREEVINAKIEPDSDQEKTLIKLRELIKVRGEAGRKSLEEDITDLMFELKLETLGVSDKSAESDGKSGMLGVPANVPVAGLDSQASALIPGPWQYSFLLSAVLGAVDPETEREFRSKIDEARQQLVKLPAKASAARIERNITIANFHLDLSEPRQAIAYLSAAEVDAIGINHTEYLKMIALLRGKVIDELGQTNGQQADKSLDATKEEAELAVKSLLRAGPLLLMANGKTSPPAGIDEAAWTADVERVATLTKMDADAWAALPAVDVVKNYYQLSRIHLALTDAAVTANQDTKGDLLVAVKSLLETEPLQLVVKGQAKVPAGIQEQTWEEDVARVQAAAKRTVEEWTERPPNDVLKDYYFLARLHTAVGVSGISDLKSVTAEAITKITQALKDRDAVDGVVRESIRALVQTDNLPKRLLKLIPAADAGKQDQAYVAIRDEVDAAIKIVQSKSDEAYLTGIGKLAGASLWADYEQLRQIESKATTWETQWAIAHAIDSPQADEKLTAWLRDHIVSKDGMLADLRKLAKVKEIPEDLVGRAAVVAIFEEMTIPGEKGSGGGVSPKTLNARLKEAEEKSKGREAAIEQSLRKDLTTKLNRVEQRINEPRPISPGQLADLQRDLKSMVKTTVAEELARMGLGMPGLPPCQIPTKPTSDADQRRAVLQFNEGCSYFYSYSTEQRPLAIRCFTMATTLDPLDPVYRYFLGCALYRDGRIVEALGQVQCAAETEKLRGSRHDVPNRLERIQFGTRRWLERCRQPILLNR